MSLTSVEGADALEETDVAMRMFSKSVCLPRMHAPACAAIAAVRHPVDKRATIVSGEYRFSVATIAIIVIVPG